MQQGGLLRDKCPESRSRSGAAALGLAAFLAGAPLLPVPAAADLPAGYTGKPYRDSLLEIPGRIRLFRFDEGPKHMAWWDVEGSNKWYCKLREPAAVGLQLMGAGGDKWEPGKAEPGMSLVKDDCYLAQTNTGDWTKYTVRVRQKGTYSLSFLEAASATNIPFVGVSFLTAKDSVGTGQVTLPLTGYFHDWVYAKNLAAVALDTGLQVMRFDILGNGPMNINFIDFAPVPGTALERASGTRPGIGLRIGRATCLPGGRVEMVLAGAGEGVLEISVLDPSGKAWLTASVPPPAGRPAVFRLPEGRRGLVLLRVRQGGDWSPARMVYLED